MRTRAHHLSPKVFASGPRVVSLTVCTQGRARLFADSALAVPAFDLLREIEGVLALCLMPDHLHLVVVTGSPAAVVKRVKGAATAAIRRLRPGLRVWQSGYYDHVVRRSEGLLDVMRYVLMNPVRAGLVRGWWVHPYSAAPVLGDLGPHTFTTAPREDVLWREVLAGTVGGASKA